MSITALFVGLIGVPGVANAASQFANLTLTPSTQPAVVGTQVSISVLLSSPFTNGTNVTIRYTVSGPNATTGTVSTDLTGNATITYFGGNSGTDTVNAYADLNNNGAQNFGDPSATASVVWSGTSITTATLTLTPSTQTLSQGSTASIAVALADPAPLSNVSSVVINYTVSGPNATSGTVTTDIGGHATISYVGNAVGTDSISAYANYTGTPSGSASVVWSSGSTSLSLAPSTQTLVPGATAAIAVHLTNLFSNVNGIPIRYTVSGPNATSGTATTDVNGNATISYVGSNVGSDTVNAYADLNGNTFQNTGEPSSSATVVWSNTPASLTLTPSTQTLAPGSTASIAVNLTNPYASDSGIPIRYTVSGPNATSGTVTTDVNGNATISYVGSNVGSDTVNAYADLNGNSFQNTGEPSSSATVVWSTTAASLTLTPSTQTLVPGSTASVAVNLTNPYASDSGVPIRYVVSGANGTSGTVSTDINGNATVSYVGGNSGTDTVTAYADLQRQRNSKYRRTRIDRVGDMEWPSPDARSCDSIPANRGLGVNHRVL